MVETTLLTTWQNSGVHRMWYVDAVGEVFQYIADTCLIGNRAHVAIAIRARDNQSQTIAVEVFRKFRGASIEEVRIACRKNPKLQPQINTIETLKKAQRSN